MLSVIILGIRIKKNNGTLFGEILERIIGSIIGLSLFYGLDIS